MKSWRTCWAVCFLVAAAAGTAFGALHVDGSSQAGPPDGTQQFPFTTIQAALDAASDGESIWVAQGAYDENLIVSNDTLSLYGGYETNGWTRDAAANESVIDGGGVGVVVRIEGWSCVLDGFSVTNGMAEAQGAGGIDVSGDWAEIRNCRVADNTGIGQDEWGAGGILMNSGRILNCRIEYNHSPGGAGGVRIGGGGVDIENTIIARNTGNMAIHVNDSTGTIVNCTIVGNPAGGFGLNISPMQVVNCIEWDNGWNWGDLSQASYSLLDGGTGDAFPGTGVLLDANPVFVEPDADDYHLRLGSPCIDTGDPDPAYNDPDGSRADMGVYGGPAGESYTYEDAPPIVDDWDVVPGILLPGDTVTLYAAVFDSATSVSSVVATIEQPDETVQATLTLYDDGAHSDGNAGDGVFANSWTTPPGIEAYYFVDLAVEDDQGHAAEHDNLASFETHVPGLVHADIANDTGVEDGSAANPFNTITEALAAASGGDTILVYDGVYNETLVLDQPMLSLRSVNGPALTAVVATNPAAWPELSVIEVIADNVTVHGFAVYGATEDDGTGILVWEADECTIVSNWCGYDAAHANESGIGLIESERCVVGDNKCKANSGVGIWLDYAGENSVFGNACRSNGFVGIQVEGGGGNSVAGNDCSENGWYGFLAEECEYNNVQGNLCSSNGWFGIGTFGGVRNRFWFNTLTENGIQSVDSESDDDVWRSPTYLSYGYNGEQFSGHLGNHYGDGQGTDADGDGIATETYVTDAGLDHHALQMPAAHYDLSAWWLGVNGRLHDDTRIPVGGVELKPSETHVWFSTEVFPMGATFGGETPWFGQLVFPTAPGTNDMFTVSVGYSTNGTAFVAAGPDATIAGNNDNALHSFVTEKQAFGIPAGGSLAVRIVNDSSTGYEMLAGPWCHVSAPGPDTNDLVDIGVYPGSLDFGVSSVGYPATQTVTVANAGYADLNVETIAVTGASFSSAASGGFTLSAGETFDIDVEFAPAAEASYAGWVTITSSDASDPVMTVDLSGEGLYPPTVTVSPLSLDVDVLGSQVVTQQVTIDNSGGQGIAQFSATIAAHSYTWTDSDTPGGPIFDWIDAATAGMDTGIAADDGDMVEAPIGFPFNFYGETYTHVMVGENGYLSFVTDGWSDSQNAPLPHWDGPNGLIAPFWDDHNIENGGAIYYETRGTAPDRQFVVEWQQVPLYEDISAVLTYEVILQESGNEILFQYLDMPGWDGDGSQATIGIEDHEGDMGVEVIYNQSYVHDDLAVLFRPATPGLTTDPLSGLIAPGGLGTVDVVCDASGVNPGLYDAGIQILLNDPTLPEVYIDIALDVIADDDGDGLPDRWEAFQFGTLSRDGSGDFDHDGALDRDEWRMGTSAGAQSEFLHIGDVAREGGAGEFVFEWDTILGRTYAVQHTHALGASWSNTGFVVEGDGAWMRYTNASPSATQCFYRVCVESFAAGEVGEPTGPMTFIPAGGYRRGDLSDTGNGDEIPAHNIDVSAFWMDQTLVTRSLWNEVLEWAVTNNYAFDRGSEGGDGTLPIADMNWYDCVKWCNARSKRDGYSPVYFTDTNQTTEYKSGQIDLSNGCVDWEGDGYRLPTEAEWEKAARGRLVGKRFPLGDSISHADANYSSVHSLPYDDSADAGWHPAYGNGPNPVMDFAPNAYHIYDTAGNLIEWTWDWYQDDWYRDGDSRQADTHGPAGSPNDERSVRGGSFSESADLGRCSKRGGAWEPGWTFDDGGFRCVRTE